MRAPASRQSRRFGAAGVEEIMGFRFVRRGMFRGRELSHPELGMAVLTRFAEELKETASIEKAAKLEGRNMTMILVSK